MLAQDTRTATDRIINEGTRYEGWEGCNNEKWSTRKELKALILADLKKAGIKATIKFNPAGYLLSLTVTIQMSKSCIIPITDFDCKLPVGGWLSYQENGHWTEIHSTNYYNLPTEEQREMALKIKQAIYYHSLQALQNPGTNAPQQDQALTEDGRRILRKALEVVHSYNRDCSDAMTDYFERSIYDHYAIKFID